MKKTFAVPTHEELRELFTLQHAEHSESDACQICQLRESFTEDKAVRQLLMMCIELGIAGPASFMAAFAHFFRAGMLWQEKQSGIVKDSDELSRIFNICDDRDEKKRKD